MLNFMMGGHPLAMPARGLLQTLIRNHGGETTRLALLIHKAHNLLLIRRNKVTRGFREPSSGDQEQQRQEEENPRR
jgi:hypothetical protein